MVFSPGDCNGLSRLVRSSGGSLYVPKGALQWEMTIANSAINLITSQATPTPRMLYFFNNSPSKTTIYLSIGSVASLTNYTYPLHQWLMLQEIDGGDLWSAIVPPGQIGTIRITYVPLIKV